MYEVKYTDRTVYVASTGHQQALFSDLEDIEMARVVTHRPWPPQLRISHLKTSLVRCHAALGSPIAVALLYAVKVARVAPGYRSPHSLHQCNFDGHWLRGCTRDLDSVAHRGTSVAQHLGGHCNILYIDGTGSGVELHRTVQSSIVEEIKVDILNHVSLRVLWWSFEAKAAWREGVGTYGVVDSYCRGGDIGGAGGA